MNALNMLRLFAGSIVIAIAVGGCATQPIPGLSQPQSSGLGIDVTLTAPVGIFSNRPTQMYFAKIDGEGGILQQSIIRSNYVKDGRAYLLNAQPGAYVAVAAFFSRAAPGAPLSRYTTYFSKELVDQTRVMIGANDFAFMGSYVVGQSVGLAEADAVQTHYQNVVAPGATTGGFLHLMSGDYHYRGTLVERKNDEQTRNEFVRNAKEDLAGSGWTARLK